MRIMARDVAAFVAHQHGLTVAQLYSQRRTRAYARPRQVAMYCIRQVCPHMSYPGIGLLIGGRDHTTILHGVRKITSLIPFDYEVAAAVHDTLAHFRDLETTDTGSPLVRALQWNVMCSQYGQAMKAAA